MRGKGEGENVWYVQHGSGGACCGVALSAAASRMREGGVRGKGDV